MLIFHRNVEEFNNFSTSVCPSKLVDIMNGYNKGEAKSLGLAFSGNQTKNPVLAHVLYTAVLCIPLAAEEYVAFHLQWGDSARMLQVAHRLFSLEHNPA